MSPPASSATAAATAQSPPPQQQEQVIVPDDSLPQPQLPPPMMDLEPGPVAVAAEAVVAGPSSPAAEWEEPHPGQLLPIPIGGGQNRSASSEVAGTYQVTGGCRGAIAAKGYSPYHNRALLVKRNPKLRFRNTMPKPLKIPAEVPEEPEQRSAPLPNISRANTTTIAPLVFNTPPTSTPTRPPFMTAAAAPATITPSLEPMALEIIEPNSTADIEMVTVDNGPAVAAVEGETVHHTTSGTSLHLQLTDFSNHLGITMEATPTVVDEDEILAVVDTEAMVTPSSEDDMYGWEAELDRKLELGFPVPPAPENLYTFDPNFEYRRSDLPKRGLLQRVLSLGSIPKDASGTIGGRRASGGS